MDQRNPGRYPEIVHVQAPRGMNRALDRLADQQHTTKSALVRQTLLREINTAGVPLGDVGHGRG
jgi:predicted transcriptional regulator